MATSAGHPTWAVLRAGRRNSCRPQASEQVAFGQATIQELHADVGQGAQPLQACVSSVEWGQSLRGAVRVAQEAQKAFSAMAGVVLEAGHLLMGTHQSLLLYSLPVASPDLDPRA